MPVRQAMGVAEVEGEIYVIFDDSPLDPDYTLLRGENDNEAVRTVG